MELIRSPHGMKRDGHDQTGPQQEHQPSGILFVFHIGRLFNT
jgi:hypothetical protein